LYTVNAPAVVEDGQNFVVGQLPVFALADKRAERRGADLAGTDIELSLRLGFIVEQHPPADVLTLKVAFSTHRRSQLYTVFRKNGTNRVSGITLKTQIYSCNFCTKYR